MTDQELADDIRTSVNFLAEKMNVASERGINVSFTIPQVARKNRMVFEAAITITKVIPL